MLSNTIAIIALFFFTFFSIVSATNVPDEVDFKKFLKRRMQGKPREGQSSDEYPWERSGKFEGDILLSESQSEALSAAFSMTAKRNGIIDATKIWPGGVIPYEFSNDFESSEQEQVVSAMQDIQSKSCLQFRERISTDNDYITIKRQPKGCFSMVGMQGGAQVMNLHPEMCFTHGTIMHELLHSTGFFHMQSNSERDGYVEINWENIDDDEYNNFKKYSALEVTNFGVPYDYDSIMHYSSKAFSKNNQDTITPLQPVEIGQRSFLSAGDVKKLNLMYECQQTNTDGTTEPSPEHNGPGQSSRNLVAGNGEPTQVLQNSKVIYLTLASPQPRTEQILYEIPLYTKFVQTIDNPSNYPAGNQIIEHQSMYPNAVQRAYKFSSKIVQNNLQTQPLISQTYPQILEENVQSVTNLQNSLPEHSVLPPDIIKRIWTLSERNTENSEITREAVLYILQLFLIFLRTPETTAFSNVTDDSYRMSMMISIGEALEKLLRRNLQIRLPNDSPMVQPELNHENDLPALQVSKESQTYIAQDKYTNNQYQLQNNQNPMSSKVPRLPRNHGERGYKIAFQQVPQETEPHTVKTDHQNNNIFNEVKPQTFSLPEHYQNPTIYGSQENVINVGNPIYQLPENNNLYTANKNEPDILIHEHGLRKPLAPISENYRNPISTEPKRLSVNYGNEKAELHKMQEIDSENHFYNGRELKRPFTTSPDNYPKPISIRPLKNSLNFSKPKNDFPIQQKPDENEPHTLKDISLSRPTSEELLQKFFEYLSGEKVPKENSPQPAQENNPRNNFSNGPKPDETIVTILKKISKIILPEPEGVSKNISNQPVEGTYLQNVIPNTSSEPITTPSENYQNPTEFGFDRSSKTYINPNQQIPDKNLPPHRPAQDLPFLSPQENYPTLTGSQEVPSKQGINPNHQTPNKNLLQEYNISPQRLQKTGPYLYPQENYQNPTSTGSLEFPSYQDINPNPQIPKKNSPREYSILSQKSTHAGPYLSPKENLKNLAITETEEVPSNEDMKPIQQTPNENLSQENYISPQNPSQAQPFVPLQEHYQNQMSTAPQEVPTNQDINPKEQISNNKLPQEYDILSQTPTQTESILTQQKKIHNPTLTAKQEVPSNQDINKNHQISIENVLQELYILSHKPTLGTPLLSPQGKNPTLTGSQEVPSSEDINANKQISNTNLLQENYILSKRPTHGGPFLFPKEHFSTPLPTDSQEVPSNQYLDRNQQIPNINLPLKYYIPQQRPIHGRPFLFPQEHFPTPISTGSQEVSSNPDMNPNQQISNKHLVQEYYILSQRPGHGGQFLSPREHYQNPKLNRTQGFPSNQDINTNKQISNANLLQEHYILSKRPTHSGPFLLPKERFPTPISTDSQEVPSNQYLDPNQQIPNNNLPLEYYIPQQRPTLGRPFLFPQEHFPTPLSTKSQEVPSYQDMNPNQHIAKKKLPQEQNILLERPTHGGPFLSPQEHYQNPKSNRTEQEQKQEIPSNQDMNPNQQHRPAHGAPFFFPQEHYQTAVLTGSQEEPSNQDINPNQKIVIENLPQQPYILSEKPTHGEPFLFPKEHFQTPILTGSHEVPSYVGINPTHEMVNQNVPYEQYLLSQRPAHSAPFFFPQEHYQTTVLTGSQEVPSNQDINANQKIVIENLPQEQYIHSQKPSHGEPFLFPKEHFQTPMLTGSHEVSSYIGFNPNQQIAIENLPHEQYILSQRPIHSGSFLFPQEHLQTPMLTGYQEVTFNQDINPNQEIAIENLPQEQYILSQRSTNGEPLSAHKEHPTLTGSQEVPSNQDINTNKQISNLIQEHYIISKRPTHGGPFLFPQEHLQTPKSTGSQEVPSNQDIYPKKQIPNKNLGQEYYILSQRPTHGGPFLSPQEHYRNPNLNRIQEVPSYQDMNPNQQIPNKPGQVLSLQGNYQNPMLTALQEVQSYKYINPNQQLPFENLKQEYFMPSQEPTQTGSTYKNPTLTGSHNFPSSNGNQMGRIPDQNVPESATLITQENYSMLPKRYKPLSGINRNPTLLEPQEFPKYNGKQGKLKLIPERYLQTESKINNAEDNFLEKILPDAIISIYNQLFTEYPENIEPNNPITLQNMRYKSAQHLFRNKNKLVEETFGENIPNSRDRKKCIFSELKRNNPKLYSLIASLVSSECLKCL